MEKIKVFCPGTVANLSCGFDVLGLALDHIGDEMVITKTSQKGVRISSITGQDLPYEPEKNVAGVAALALLQQLDVEVGFDIEIHKKIKPGSGIGSSAASAAGAVWGINKLLNEPFTNHELVAFAMEGENLASGTRHADNVAPALLGGITLVRSIAPLEIISLPVPNELYCTVVHPQIEVKTSEARNLLQPNVPLKKAIEQWANLGAFVSALYTNDYELLSRSLQDVIVEPVRELLIPNFNKVKEIASNVGAIGTGIAGSGPSIFVLTKGDSIAKEVGKELKKVFSATSIENEVYISKINTVGIKEINL